MRTVRIFLSSPSDCQAERTATHAVVARLNVDPVVSSFARIEVVAWDWATGIPFDALTSPQASVNRRLPVPEDCDVFVGIFRCRFGTPLPTNEFRRDDGAPFRSGSEYEFHRAWHARRRGAAVPEMLMYRLDMLSTGACPAGEQLDLLNDFFEASPFKDRDRWTGAVNRFRDTADFDATLEGHLRVVLSQWHPNHKLPLPEWLERHARRVEHDAGPRYTREAHVDSEVSQVFDWLLARPKAIHALDSMLSEIWQKLDDPGFAPFKPDLQRIASALREDPRWATPPDFDLIAHTLDQLEDKAWELEHAAESGPPSSSTSDQYRRYRFTQVAVHARDALHLLRDYASFAQNRVLLLTGPAGQGKTHTLVHEIRRELASGGIAVGVLAQTLSDSGDLRSALLQFWGHAGSFDGFLDAIENAAAQNGQRALIVVDALNETPNRARWKNELNGIVRQVLERPHLALALSVRSDYRLHVLPDIASGHTALWVEHGHMGFAGIEPNALLAYCAHYGVTAPVAPPIGELGNPLYVQLLVKSLQGRSTPSHWLPSWLEVWTAWIDRLEADARGRLTVDPSRSQPVRRCLNKLAATMIASGRFRLSRVKADEIAHTTTGVNGLVGLLCSAGALIDRVEDDDDIVEFGFERLSDTFFADRLLDRLFADKSEVSERRAALAAALSSTGELRALGTPGHSEEPLADRRSGLLEALCLAAPARIGVELPELIPVEAPDSQGWIMPDAELRDAFTDSLRWRCRPDEFAGDRLSLWRTYRRRGAHLSTAADLDELIRLALIPGHPFALEHVLHPRLMRRRSVGARDAIWSVELASLWRDDGSNLSVLIRWASESNLTGLHADTALSAARLLAWVCATSQQTLREHATRGLTRVLVACPEVLAKTLSDFLAVNDDYVLESVLTATWGVMIDGRHPDICAPAARQVHDGIFGGDSPRCHLTIRHYARGIVETACERNWLCDVDLSRVRPPYRSTLPLDQVPSESELRALDASSGFCSIVGSALGHDFYWYVMGATSGGKPFSSQPLPHSSEPVRAYGDGQPEASRRALSGIFDIPLAARFVVWNCNRLGWTADRFNEFDTGSEVRGQSRMERAGRTERIGKKYQWISWQTMLAFLADNYQMTPEALRGPRQYDTPHQIGYIEVLDPSRWLGLPARPAAVSSNDHVWQVPSLPRWPTTDDDLRNWGASETFDLPAVDVISHAPTLPVQWGEGHWMCVAAEHTWSSPAMPGVWGLNQERDADIWWQLTPALIQSADLPGLLDALERPKVQRKLMGIGRIDLESDWNLQLAEWPGVGGSFDRGLEDGGHSGHDAWLPVPWMYLTGTCGDPDRRDEHGPVILPWPRLFRDWGLQLDLEHGVVRHGDAVVFGLAGWVMGEDALFARRHVLVDLLAKNGLSLVWWLRGERRAFVREFGSGEAQARVWIDSHGIAYLARDGRPQVAWLAREQRE